MKQGATWYKRDPRAFLDGAQGLGPELIGAYAVLLDLIYARAGESSRDDRHLAGVMGCSSRKAKALTDALIDRGKIQFADGFLTNPRADTDARSAQDISEARSKAGRKGGEKSGEVRKNNSLGEAKPEAKRSTNKRREEKKDNPLTPKGEDGDLFGESSPAEKSPADILAEVIPMPLAEQFVDHRRSLGKAKVLTVNAANIMANRLRGRGDAAVMVETAIMNGWQGVVFPDQKPVGKQFGQQPGSSSEGLLRRAHGGTQR